MGRRGFPKRRLIVRFSTTPKAAVYLPPSYGPPEDLGEVMKVEFDSLTKHNIFLKRLDEKLDGFIQNIWADRSCKCEEAPDWEYMTARGREIQRLDIVSDLKLLLKMQENEQETNAEESIGLALRYFKALTMFKYHEEYQTNVQLLRSQIRIICNLKPPTEFKIDTIGKKIEDIGV